MEKFADLHIHTYFSDSTSSPQEVVDEAHQAGLSCIAITDHDTVDGIKPTIEAAKKVNLEVISGVELSTEMNGRDVHMLAYLFDYEHPNLAKALDIMQNSRVERMEQMIEKIKALGLDNIELEEVCALAKSKSVGRPHLATVMMERGWVKSIKMAFDKYLAEGAPAYVPKFKRTPQEAIAIVKECGGISILAHPMVTKIDELIPQLSRDGLDGIEVYYPNTPNNVITFYEGLAKKHDLLMTGGSDAHGKSKVNTFIGKRKIPYDLVEKLKLRI